MFRSKVPFVLAVAAVAVLGFVVSQAVSQDTTSRPARGPGGGQGGPRDPEAMHKAMLDRMKETLGATDDEWKALEPKVDKVMTLSNQIRGRGMFGGRGGRGGASADNAPAPQSDVEKKAADLRKVLDNKDAKPDEIKAALAGYREARDKAKVELEKAQKDLKEVLTQRQEAQLVTMGMLD